MNTPQEFDELHRALARIEVEDGATAAALVTIVRTRGSTFRRAGARMLVGADGSLARGLSGGCPEQDILTHAKCVIASGVAEIVRYDGATGLDVMMEMGCGGELDVLIEPVASGGRNPVFDWVARLFERRGSGWMATVFAVDDACIIPRPGHLAYADGQAGDDFRDAVIAGLRPAMRTALMARLGETIINRSTDSRASVHRLDVDGHIVDVLLERLVPPHALLLLGANASSLALARLAVSLGWQVTVVDPRPEAAVSGKWPAAVRHDVADADGLRHRLAVDSRTSVVIMTHHLQRDLAFLDLFRSKPVAYLGAIGSRERAARMLGAAGSTVTPLHVPAGLDIGSETPEEIALAIAAEIVAVLAGRSGVPLSHIGRPIH